MTTLTEGGEQHSIEATTATTTEHGDHRVGSVELSAFVCPRGGTILDLSNRIRPGWFECPACRGVHAVHSVVRDA